MISAKTATLSRETEGLKADNSGASCRVLLGGGKPEVRFSLANVRIMAAAEYWLTFTFSCFTSNRTCFVSQATWLELGRVETGARKVALLDIINSHAEQQVSLRLCLIVDVTWRVSIVEMVTCVPSYMTKKSSLCQAHKKVPPPYAGGVPAAIARRPWLPCFWS